MTLGAARLLFRVAVVVTLLAGVSADLDCNGCYGRGTLVYHSPYICRCSCSKNETSVTSGIVMIEEFLPPDCRYSTAQVARAVATVTSSLAGFSFVQFASTITYNLGLNSTASLYLNSLTNSSTTVTVKFEFRDDGVDFNSIQRATYDLRLFLQEVTARSSWVTAANINSAKQVVAVVSAPSTVAVLFSLSGYPIPTETAIIVGAILIVFLAVCFSDLIMSNNFYRTDEEADAALDNFKRAQLAGDDKYLHTDVIPAQDETSPRASPEVAPKQAWESNDDASASQDDVQEIRSRRKQSANDYSSKFYANA